MRAPRVFLESARPGALVDLPPQESHHIDRVLRRGVGDPVEVVGSGGCVLAGSIAERVEQDGGVLLRVRVGEPLEENPPALPPWTIAVAPVTEKNLDLAARMASELGLERLIPLVGERSEVRLPRGGARSGRLQRWERIARESAKQCGRAGALSIGAVATIDDVLEEARSDARRAWIAAPGEPAPDLVDLAGGGAAVFLLGPEGGFSPQEIQAAERLGARRLGLPTPVLRTPTAVCLIAALRVLLQWAKP